MKSLFGDNNIIHIQNQDNTASGWAMVKDKMIRSRMLESIPQKHWIDQTMHGEIALDHARPFASDIQGVHYLKQHINFLLDFIQ